LPAKLDVERRTGAVCAFVVRIEKATESSVDEGYMTNISESFMWEPMPTAAHPVFWSGKRAERWRERSFASVVSL
jgi:hypothetical protein